MPITTRAKVFYVACFACAIVALVFVGGEVGFFEETSKLGQVHQMIRSAIATRSSWSRDDTINCMLQYVDGLRETRDSRGHVVYVLDASKKDECIDDSEISNAKMAYLSSFERAIGWVAKETNEKIMRKCDFDVEEENKTGKPHCISLLDMHLSNKSAACESGVFFLLY